MEIIIFALGLGFTTGFHCLGMCGPIALALGLNMKNKFKFYLQNLMYQFGRLITYTFLGSISGLVGKSFNLIGIQNQISIIVGILLLFLSFSPNFIYNFSKFIFLDKFLIKIKLCLSFLLRQNSTSSKLLIGILNGFLPCGAVYIALTASIAFSKNLDSIIFMFFFGLGTIPIMFLSVLLGNIFKNKFKYFLLKFYSFILILFSIMLILRGMELGIPHISPNKNSLKIKTNTNCCK